MDKKCSKCKESKPIDQFHKNRTSKDGYGFWCKKCVKENKKKYYKENGKNKRLKKTYGISEVEYNKKRESQYNKYGDICPICKIRKANNYDHEHETYIFRGFICGVCNKGLGLFGDTNIERLERAILYIKGNLIPL